MMTNLLLEYLDEEENYDERQTTIGIRDSHRQESNMPVRVCGRLNEQEAVPSSRRGSLGSRRRVTRITDYQILNRW
jgi:hypothetical protein